MAAQVFTSGSTAQPTVSPGVALLNSRSKDSKSNENSQVSAVLSNSPRHAPPVGTSSESTRSSATPGVSHPRRQQRLIEDATPLPHDPLPACAVVRQQVGQPQPTCHVQHALHRLPYAGSALRNVQYVEQRP